MNHLIEIVLFSTLNICFCLRNKKIIFKYALLSYLGLSIVFGFSWLIKTNQDGYIGVSKH